MKFKLNEKVFVVPAKKANSLIKSIYEDKIGVITRLSPYGDDIDEHYTVEFPNTTLSASSFYVDYLRPVKAPSLEEVL